VSARKSPSRSIRSGSEVLPTELLCRHPLQVRPVPATRLRSRFVGALKESEQFLVRVLTALLGGSKAEVDFNDILRRRLTITGSTLHSRSREFKSAIEAELRQKVWPLIEAKKIRPVIFRVFALAGAAGAHALMESGAHIGKIILKVAER